MASVTAPSDPVDLFEDAVLTDPYPAYERLRDLAPAVWLPRHDAWAVARYADVKAVLGDAETFSSVDGVALTELANTQILKGTVLASDGPDHARLRRPLSRQLNPRAMRNLTDGITARAEHVVEVHTEGGTFDAALLAQQYVADIVMKLMGLPESTRDRLIHGAAATFDVFGPANGRYQEAAPAAAAVIEFLYEEVTRQTVTEDSWMAAIYAAADAGELDESDVVPLMSAYTAAGMDTTIFAIGAAIQYLSADPAQWARLRSGEADGEDAFREAIRMDAPVQGFGRRVTRDTDIGGVPVAAGDQLWLVYGSTGRDPRHWGADADTFRVDRPGTAEHLALGHGPHLCAGNHLAALEARSLLNALARRFSRLEPAGEPVRVLNNVLRGWGSVPVSVS